MKTLKVTYPDCLSERTKNDGNNNNGPVNRTFPSILRSVEGSNR